MKVGESVKTDIDRLHKVATGELVGRGCGKSFKLCYDIVSAVMLGERTICVIVPQMGWVWHIRKMLLGILEENDIKIEKVEPDEILLCQDIKIHFVSSKNRAVDDEHPIIEGFRGAIVDFREEERLIQELIGDKPVYAELRKGIYIVRCVCGSYNDIDAKWNTVNCSCGREFTVLFDKERKETVTVENRGNGILDVVDRIDIEDL